MLVVPEEDLILILKDVDSLPYTQQYTRWALFLLQLEENGSDSLVLYLEMFLENFPFTFVYWAKLISLKPEDQRIDTYTKALAKNPKCIELWKLYIDKVKQIGENTKYKRELERAILEVGADIHSYDFFEQYYPMITDNCNTKYEFFKKLFTRALDKLQLFWEKFQQWVLTLSQAQLHNIYYKEMKELKTGADPLEYIKTQMSKLYKGTLTYRKSRQDIEARIKQFYFNDHPDRPFEMQWWRKYIYLQRQHAVVENISYCYERCLLSHTQLIPLWQETFHYLENETGKYLTVLNIFRNHSQFFMTLSPFLYFYWCDLEERENPQQARQMYIRMENYKPVLGAGPDPFSFIQVYLRHIQLQMRQNRLDNAKNIYDHLLLSNQSDTEVLCYVLVEYASFIARAFKEMDFTKKLYSTYFEALPFNNYLFLNYLHFMRGFENNEGYYDELMSILIQGYNKAKQTSQSLGERAMTLIKQHLKSSLGSINLIKISDKRLFELESLTHEN